VKLTELARDVERFTSHLGSGWFDVFLLANKMRLVLHDVVQHWHWLLTRELLHQIVRSGKDSIATILGHGYMLLDVRGVTSNSRPEMNEKRALYFEAARKKSGSVTAMAKWSSIPRTWRRLPALPFIPRPVVSERGRRGDNGGELKKGKFTHVNTASPSWKRKENFYRG
jgi:hypothetical protein